MLSLPNAEPREHPSAPRSNRAARKLPSIRWAIFATLALLTLTGGGASLLISFNLIGEAVLGEAQRRTDGHLASAWAQYNHELDRVQVVVRLMAATRVVRETLEAEPGADVSAARARLESFRKEYGLDTLTLIDPNGRVSLRTRPPYWEGDTPELDPICSRAMRGESVSGTVIVPEVRLLREGKGLSEQAFLDVVPTPMAGPRPQVDQRDGMMLGAAEPVFDTTGRLIGIIRGGVLLNRNDRIPDSIRDTIFRGETYRGKQVGTVTLFQGDVRISTNVLNDDGSRAVGTMVSSLVGDRIRQGLSYRDRAFVVNDWYITAYDPIRDPDGRVIGMLYVGVLEQKFLDYREQLIRSVAGLMGAGVLSALAIALALAFWLSAPISKLTRAASSLSKGDQSARVREGREVFKELSSLNRAFNEMADAVASRGEMLAHTNADLEKTNAELSRMNQAYVEMLGFVTHELKSPLASSSFSVAALRDGYFGAISPEQRKVIESVERNLARLDEMILNYLNLARIERDELKVVREPVRFLADVLTPVVDQFQRELDASGMTLLCEVGEDVLVQADSDMLQVVLQNILSNAVKYGRSQSQILVRHERVDGVDRFSVRNTGPGIRPDDANRLFRKFSRLDVTNLRVHKGTGLGLFITRTIVEGHGGTIRVDSKEGEWFEIVFELPV